MRFRGRNLVSKQSVHCLSPDHNTASSNCTLACGSNKRPRQVHVKIHVIWQALQLTHPHICFESNRRTTCSPHLTALCNADSADHIYNTHPRVVTLPLFARQSRPSVDLVSLFSCPRIWTSAHRSCNMRTCGWKQLPRRLVRSIVYLPSSPCLPVGDLSVLQSTFKQAWI